jgi:peroxiredoxin family protein
MAESGRPQVSTKVAVFVHSGDYDRLHQAVSIAATATASGRACDLFFFWFALEALAKGELAEPRFPARPDLEERFEERRIPSAQALLEAARATGLCTVYACTGSGAITGIRPDQLEGKADHLVGWTTILQVTAGVSDRFYL